MKQANSLAVLKERLCLAAMIHCRAGGRRSIDMLALAKHVGVFREGCDSCDLEKTLCAYIRDKIDARHARSLLAWMITQAGHADAPVKPPMGIPGTHPAWPGNTNKKIVAGVKKVQTKKITFTV